MSNRRKATCDQPRVEPVTICHADGKDWVYIYVNEEQAETEHGSIQYVYDYNEFNGTNLPLEDIKANPESYLDYTPPALETPEERISRLEALIAQLLGTGIA